MLQPLTTCHTRKKLKEVRKKMKRRKLAENVATDEYERNKEKKKTKSQKLSWKMEEGMMNKESKCALTSALAVSDTQTGAVWLGYEAQRRSILSFASAQETPHPPHPPPPHPHPTGWRATERAAEYQWIICASQQTDCLNAPSNCIIKIKRWP